jgi:hypothetical protein
MSDLSKQALFDRAVRRLAVMPQMAAKWEADEEGGPEHPRCQYRSPNGPCLVGAEITDAEYAPPQGFPGTAAKTMDDLSSTSVREIFCRDLLPKRLEPHIDLFERLQELHDNRGVWQDRGRGPIVVSEVRRKMLWIADVHGISNGVVHELWPDAAAA